MYTPVFVNFLHGQVTIILFACLVIMKELQDPTDLWGLHEALALEATIGIEGRGRQGEKSLDARQILDHGSDRTICWN
mgnify:CR=1 FL=1